MPQSSVAVDTEDDDRKGGKGSKAKDLSHVPCKFFKVGGCTAGPSCPFSHSQLEPGQQKQPCTWFVKGSCKFGHKCALAHILPGQPMSMDRKNKKQAQQAAAAEKSKDGGGSATSNTPKTERSKRGQTHAHNGSKENVSSVNLRPQISMIGKGSTISASVTPAPVHRDSTSLTSAAELFALSAADRQPSERARRQQSLSSDRSSTPQQDDSTLPAGEHAASTSPALTNSGSQFPTPSGRAQPLPMSSPVQRRPSPLPSSPPSHPRMTRTGDSGYGPIGSPSRAGAGFGINIGSPTRLTTDHDFGGLGPIGSPTRAPISPTNQRSSSPLGIASPGRGTLANLLANLTGSSNPQADKPTQSSAGVLNGFVPSSSPSRERGFHHHTDSLDQISSSLTGRSVAQNISNPSHFGSSPFSAPGSKSLFMYQGNGGEFEPSSSTSQSHLHSQFNGGYPASFAGATSHAWDSGRRPSLPHNQRPPVSFTGVLDESALDEDPEAEEFLPSSLNELLTPEEQMRRYSRTGGARPNITRLDEEDSWRPGGGGGAGRGLGGARQVDQNNASMLSRSVPAASLMNNVKALWDPSNANSAANGAGIGESPTGNISRGFNTTSTVKEETFGAGSYGPSPSMLSTSNISNASNAFLRSNHHQTAGLRTIGGADTGYGRGGGLFNAGPGSPNTGTGFDSMMPSMSFSNVQRTGLGSSSNNPIPNQQNLFGSHHVSDEASSALSSMYGLHRPHHPPNLRSSATANPTATPISNGPLSPHAHALRHHEPGQSLPRGLGAGLSRIHFVPAMGVGMGGNGGGSNTGGGVNAQSFGMMGNQGHNVISGNSTPSGLSQSLSTMSLGEPNDMERNLSTTPTKHSSLASRLNQNNSSSQSTGSASAFSQFGPHIPSSASMISVKRPGGNAWGPGGSHSSPLGKGGVSSGPNAGIIEEHDDADPGTLFLMD